MDIIISSSADEPIYEQITNQIKQQILRGDLKEGDPLPSMRKLAKDLQISIITTKRAYEELEKEGFITSQVGKGSFVSGQNVSVLRDQQLQLIENKLEVVVDESKVMGIELSVLLELVTMLYKEENK
ncbi:GntR family transcriptional regulator [Cytobacillus sp. IB215665]|uniref:GntR family transcriptional regulator n=1 Tax=Cytobacillus sp. IB215665 TaxID=3097357 RepID=UPI002A181F68|nr:GntR family transcriptional regulator [Cytobacillus sp. IB215665]MDX8365990.1 GntR family transcriptional regulator [Cytobacillus sp. IB215665]